MRRTRGIARAVVFWILVAVSACGPAEQTSPPAQTPEEKAPASGEGARSSGPLEPTQVAIVGGGLAGLVTAYELEKRGVRTHVLEMQPRVGGRVGTAVYANGLRAEFGMQEMWEGNPLLDIARELGVALEDGAEAYSSVLIDGEIRAYVHETADEYLNSFLDAEERAALDAWMKSASDLHARAVSVGLSDPEVAALQEISFQQWIEQQTLPRDVAQWIELTLSCELATDWSQFSALFGLLEFRIFLNGGVLNYHVKSGNSGLVEALAERLKGPITLGARVSSIRRAAGPGERARVSFERDRHMSVLEADRVVLAVPWTHIHRIQIEPPLSDAHIAAIGGLGLGQYVVVHLMLDADADQLWLIGGETPMPVLTKGPLGVIYGDVDRNEQELVFSLLVYGAYARAFHMIPHERKVAQLVAELDRLWPGFAARVRDAHVYPYHPAAVAYWPKGRSPLDGESELLRSPSDGLYFAGDWTHNAHSDGAARSAIDVAERIAAELGASATARR